MATLRAPVAPVTSASPMVIMTASTLPAANASMDGAYSNQSNWTSTPASLNQPFWIPTSNAVQPGQSLNAIRSGLAAGAALASRTVRWSLYGVKPTVARTAAIARILFMRAEYLRHVAGRFREKRNAVTWRPGSRASATYREERRDPRGFAPAGAPLVAASSRVAAASRATPAADGSRSI